MPRVPNYQPAVAPIADQGQFQRAAPVDNRGIVQGLAGIGQALTGIGQQQTAQEAQSQARIDAAEARKQREEENAARVRSAQDAYIFSSRGLNETYAGVRKLTGRAAEGSVPIIDAAWEAQREVINQMEDPIAQTRALELLHSDYQRIRAGAMTHAENGRAEAQQTQYNELVNTNIESLVSSPDDPSLWARLDEHTDWAAGEKGWSEAKTKQQKAATTMTAANEVVNSMINQNTIEGIEQAEAWVTGKQDLFGRKSDAHLKRIASARTRIEQQTQREVAKADAEIGAQLQDILTTDGPEAFLAEADTISANIQDPSRRAAMSKTVESVRAAKFKARAALGLDMQEQIAAVYTGERTKAGLVAAGIVDLDTQTGLLKQWKEDDTAARKAGREAAAETSIDLQEQAAAVYAGPRNRQALVEAGITNIDIQTGLMETWVEEGKASALVTQEVNSRASILQNMEGFAALDPAGFGVEALDPGNPLVKDAPASVQKSAATKPTELLLARQVTVAKVQAEQEALDRDQQVQSAIVDLIRSPEIKTMDGLINHSSYGPLLRQLSKEGMAGAQAVIDYELRSIAPDAPAYLATARAYLPGFGPSGGDPSKVSSYVDNILDKVIRKRGTFWDNDANAFERIALNGEIHSAFQRDVDRAAKDPKIEVGPEWVSEWFTTRFGTLNNKILIQDFRDQYITPESESVTGTLKDVEAINEILKRNPINNMTRRVR
jgi:hypothetical protein